MWISDARRKIGYRWGISGSRSDTVEIYFDVEYLRPPWTTVDLMNETMNPSIENEGIGFFDDNRMAFTNVDASTLRNLEIYISKFVM